jgi:hypothetical protein
MIDDWDSVFVCRCCKFYTANAGVELWKNRNVIDWISQWK